ncbi:Interferon omega-1 [Myotis davidii]|uniref:Interferon omega-1 n=1 Tax=Myotis davidii TaxID=225400 RepID=L5LLX8_MYODS|nr:Interferon omega-1 [Myotis davidii]
MMSCCSSCLRFPLELSMAQIALWLVAGVMLCSLPAGSLEEDMHWVDTNDSRRVLILLSQLQRTPLHLCLADRNDFKFPWNLETITQMQKTQRTCFHHLMLLQVFHLFRAQRSLAAWDHTLLSHLLSSLHHSLERLEQREGDTRACPSVGILVRKYFQSIRNYLRGLFCLTLLGTVTHGHLLRGHCAIFNMCRHISLGTAVRSTQVAEGGRLSLNVSFILSQPSPKRSPSQVAACGNLSKPQPFPKAAFPQGEPFGTCSPSHPIAFPKRQLFSKHSLSQNAPFSKTQPFPKGTLFQNAAFPKT